MSLPIPAEEVERLLAITLLRAENAERERDEAQRAADAWEQRETQALVDLVHMERERDEARAALAGLSADTCQWGRDRDAAEMILEVLDALDEARRPEVSESVREWTDRLIREVGHEEDRRLLGAVNPALSVETSLRSVLARVGPPPSDTGADAKIAALVAERDEARAQANTCWKLSEAADKVMVLVNARAERAEASIAALVAAARRVEAAFCAAAAPAALPISTLVHPVAALTAALSDLTSAATAHDERVRQEARAAARVTLLAALDAAREEARAEAAAHDAWQRRSETAERERDEARAALAGLREAAEPMARHARYGTETPYAEWKALDAALAAAPADLVARYRAEVRRATLREAADLVDEDDTPRSAAHRSDWMEGRVQQSHAIALRLRALADEAEKT